MRNLGFNEEFDAITCFFTSINFNVTDENMESTMKGIYKGLRRGGVFIVDVPNPFRAEK